MAKFPLLFDKHRNKNDFLEYNLENFDNNFRIGHNVIKTHYSVIDNWKAGHGGFNGNLIGYNL